MQNSCLRQLEFELVEIFLIDVITDCFPGHACCAVSVLFFDDKVLAGVTKLKFCVCANIVDQLDCRMFSEVHMVCIV